MHQHSGFPAIYGHGFHGAAIDHVHPPSPPADPILREERNMSRMLPLRRIITLLAVAAASSSPAALGIRTYEDCKCFMCVCDLDPHPLPPEAPSRHQPPPEPVPSPPPPSKKSVSTCSSTHPLSHLFVVSPRHLLPDLDMASGSAPGGMPRDGIIYI